MEKVNIENKFSPFSLQNVCSTDPLIIYLIKKYKDSWSDFPNWYRDLLPISGAATIRVLFSFFVLDWGPSKNVGHWLYTILTTHLQHVYLQMEKSFLYVNKGGCKGPECYISGNLWREDREMHGANHINTFSWVAKDSNADENKDSN